jgi:hypothetical protein
MKWDVSLQRYFSCCRGDECRVTESLKEATAEQVADGKRSGRTVTHQVMVSGVWYPVDLAAVQITLTKEQRSEARANPALYAEFLSYTHVCAAWVSLEWLFNVGNSEQKQKRQLQWFLVVYCIVVEGDRT